MDQISFILSEAAYSSWENSSDSFLKAFGSRDANWLFAAMAL